MDQSGRRRTLGLGGRLVDYAAQAGPESGGPAGDASDKADRERPTLLAQLAAFFTGAGPSAAEEEAGGRRFRERAPMLRLPANPEAAG